MKRVVPVLIVIILILGVGGFFAWAGRHMLSAEKNIIEISEESRGFMIAEFFIIGDEKNE